MSDCPIAAGGLHSVFLETEHGFVFTTGSDEHCQLGNYENRNGIPPSPDIVTIKELIDTQDIICVAAATSSSYLLRSDGKLFCFGWNASGQLGLGAIETIKIPAEIKDIPQICFISAGDNHAMILDFDGNVWVTGSNSYGQLGNGESTHHITFHKTQEEDEKKDIRDLCKFTMINMRVKIESISCGTLHSLFVDENSEIWGTGWNKHLQLGQYTETDYITVPIKIESIPKMKQVSAGWIHSLFLDFDSNVWVCGSGVYGNLGIPLKDPNELISPTKVKKISSIREIYCGVKQSYLLSDCGIVYSTGNNMYGQLGLGDYLPRKVFNKIENIPEIEFIAVGSCFALLCDFDGKVWGVGSNNRCCLGISKKYQVNKPELIVNLNHKIGYRTLNSRGKSARK